MKRILITATCLCLCIVMGLLTVSGASSAAPESERYGGGIASALTRAEKCQPGNVEVYADYIDSKRFRPTPSLYAILKNYLDYILNTSLHISGMDERFGYPIDDATLFLIRANASLTPDQVKAANAKYADDRARCSYIPNFDPDHYQVDSSPPVTDWVIEAWFEEDIYKSMETLINPFYVIGYNKNGNTQAMSAWSILNSYSMEELDTWGYTTEYWLDYYTFLAEQFPVCGTYAYSSIEAYANDYRYPVNASDDNLYRSYDDGQQYLKAVKERLALYQRRIENPATGDNLPAGAGVWFAAAMLSLAVITSVIPKKRRYFSGNAT